MSKKIDNFLTEKKKFVRKACCSWIALARVVMLGFSVFFISFADYSAIQFTRDIGITPSMFMTLLGVGLTGVLGCSMLIPAYAILNKLDKLSN